MRLPRVVQASDLPPGGGREAGRRPALRRWIYIATIAALTIVAVIRVASTHRVFSATSDEPVHIAAGWIWLAGGVDVDLGHPPLGRVLLALPLRLSGIPTPPPEGSDLARGNALLYHGGRYAENLARARMGNLLLLVAAILAVAEQTRRTFGRKIAVVATALFTNTPVVLAHAGLMTTDMAGAAMMPIAILALDLFIDKPTLKRAATLGLAIGLGVLSKFSFLLFFPAAVLVLIVVRWPFRAGFRLWPIVIVLAIATVWGGYQFDSRTVSEISKDASYVLQQLVPEESQRIRIRLFSDKVPIPAPALLVGIAVLKFHDQEGHHTFLFGKNSSHGWWYYFPVVFFFKTPLPLLLLMLIGIILAIRRRRGLEHVLIPIAILLVAMTGSINIGVRHVMPMYAWVATIAAYGTVELWRRARRPFAQLGFYALMAWLFAGVAAAHPDYLAWFNEAAGPRPWRIVADSNLDWGQDTLRLEKAVRELKIDKLWVRYATGAELHRHGIVAQDLPDEPVKGWIAIGETPISFYPDRIGWLEQYEPVRRIGKGLRLYYVP